MKKILLILMTLSALAFGVDYSAMTATELAAMRSSVPEEDKAAFHEAMQQKLHELDPHQRAAALNQAPDDSPGKRNMGGNVDGMNQGNANHGSSSSSGGGHGNSGNGGGGGKGGGKK